MKNQLEKLYQNIKNVVTKVSGQLAALKMQLHPTTTG
jgi:hypothetical protein